MQPVWFGNIYWIKMENLVQIQELFCQEDLFLKQLIVPVEVDVRSFGVRTPACTKENPSYGILGLFHILPPALAWLWRLVAPRGFNNPSIIDSIEMTSEGVGSYWPFATGKDGKTGKSYY
jgi:hypothetical protein